MVLDPLLGKTPRTETVSMARVDCLQRITASNRGRDPERLRRKYAAIGKLREL